MLFLHSPKLFLSKETPFPEKNNYFRLSKTNSAKEYPRTWKTT